MYNTLMKLPRVPANHQPSWWYDTCRWADQLIQEGSAIQRTAKVSADPNDPNTTLIRIEVPGYEKEKLQVSVKDQMLVIKGEREDGERFSQTFSIGADVITSASLKNGILTVKVLEQKKQEVQIKIE